MYICVCVNRDIYIYTYMCVYMQSMQVCKCASMLECRKVGLYVCAYVCVCMYVRTYVGR